MQKNLIALAVGLTLVACDATGPTDGALVVSTSTIGGDPDIDGYQLAVDGRNPVSLLPIGSATVQVKSGRHKLTLLDVAGQCSVTGGMTLEIEVPSGEAIPVRFEVTCPANALNITTTTTGLDLPAAYRVQVNGADRGSIAPNGKVLTRIEPGTWTVSLTDLASNCTPTGPASRSVTVGYDKVVPIAFTIVCTATTGVIDVVLGTSEFNVAGGLKVSLDGGLPVHVWPASHYHWSNVLGGDHVISVPSPSYCRVETDPARVTVATGEIIRDTVKVDLSLTCTPQGAHGNLWITARTTGPISSSVQYQVWYEVIDPWGYSTTSGNLLGEIDPNGTLFATLSTGYFYLFSLTAVPSCSVNTPPPPSTGFPIGSGETLIVEYEVSCS